MPNMSLLLYSIPQANAHLKTWNTQSNGNFIQHLTGTDTKNKNDIVTPKQHRRKLQKGDGAAAAGDSKTPGTDLDVNQDEEVATEIAQTQSENGGDENGSPTAQAEKSIANRLDKDESDSVLKNESGISESGPIQNVNMLTEPIMSSSILSEGKETSAVNTAKKSKDVPLVIAYKKSDEILEDSSKAMDVDSKNMNSESNLVSEPEKSSIIAEDEGVSETNPESQKMVVKLGRVEEGTAVLHNLTSEINKLGSQGAETEDSVVESYESNSLANEESSLVGSNGVGSESLSDIDSRQTIENNVTQNTTVMESRNYDSENNEEFTAVPIDNIEAYSKQFRPHSSNEETDTVDNTEGELDTFWSTLDQNDSEDGDGSPEDTYSVSLYTRDAQEDNPQTSFDKFNNGMERRYFVQGHDPSYYVNNPAASAYMRTRRDELSHMCVVPCSPMNYIVPPYHYGYYGAAADHSYATGVQLPPLHLPQIQLPPVQFPDLHDSSSAFSSLSFDGHGGHASASENAQGQNYVLTSNAYAGTSQGSQDYGSASLSYVKEPLSHLEYSLTTPHKYVQTSLVLKPPHPYKSMHPSIHGAEKQNINLQKSTYF
jgi:hypothetical protein